MQEFCFFPRYLRRKPGKGLAIVYETRGTPGRWVTVTLNGAGRTVQVFPDDSGLPGLSESCTPSSGGAVFQALEGAARIQLNDPQWRLAAAQAEPVRYKPSSRCVIRYLLRVERAAPEGILQRNVTVFGKVYGDLEKARTVQDHMRLLYAEQAREGQPVIPRPVGGVPAYGVVLTEGIEPAVPRTGLRALQPDQLRLTAAALARLHTSAVRPSGPPRTGAKEAGRLRERAELIATRYPAQAEAAQRIAGQLASSS